MMKPHNNIHGKRWYFCHVLDETVEAHSGQGTSLEPWSQEWAERGTGLTWQPTCRVRAPCPGSPEGSEAEVKTRLALKPMAIPAQTVSLPLAEGNPFIPTEGNRGNKVGGCVAAL